MIDGKKPVSTLSRYAGEVKRSRKISRILPPIIMATVVLLVIIYLLSLLLTKYGSFTIKIKDYQERSYSLSLCETDSFKTHSSRLVADEVKNVTNISYVNLPENLNDVNGPHNGDNYLAYTFYVKNTGEKACGYNYRLVITRATVGIDAAARVRIYYTPDYYVKETDTFLRSGDYVDYAKPKTGGNGEPEVNDGRVMTNFVSNDVIAEGTAENFKPGDISKMTVVIWLEGDDPDCNDSVLGGQLKVDMVVEIIGADDT